MPPVHLVAVDKPLLLLDVDGVINDVEMLIHLHGFEPEARAAEMDRLGLDEIESHGYHVVIPRYMPELIQALDARAEIVWLTTWRLRANDDIAPHLGVGPYPALDPHGSALDFAWKPEAARTPIADALAAGRDVIWIEDFNGDIPDIDCVIYVDTGEREVLRWSDLPVDVLDKSPARAEASPTAGPPPRCWSGPRRQ